VCQLQICFSVRSAPATRKVTREDDGELYKLTLERNKRLSRVARILEDVAARRDDSSLRQLAAEMRAAMLDDSFSSSTEATKTIV